MQVTSTELERRLDVEVDPDADPVDVDEAVARFLLAFIKRNGPPCKDDPFHVSCSPVSKGATSVLYSPETES